MYVYIYIYKYLFFKCCLIFTFIYIKNGLHAPPATSMGSRRPRPASVPLNCSAHPLASASSSTQCLAPATTLPAVAHTPPPSNPVPPHTRAPT